MNCATPKPCGRVFFQLRVRKINTGVTSYLAFSVPRPSILRVLALALAFLLPSVGKFAQQRLRGSCRERKGQNHVSRSALCDLSKKKEALLNCVLCLFFYHCISFSLSSPSLRSAFLWSSYTNSPVRWCWQALPILATAGSLWKSIARYCWNNNHSNRSCKYLWDGNTGPLCQPKLISRRRSCSWRIIPPCFTVTAISSFIWNFYVFFHSAAISVSTSLGCMVWETADIDVTVLFSVQTLGAG